MCKRRVNQWETSISIKVSSQHCGIVQYVHYKIVFLPLANQTKLYYITVLAMSHTKKSCSLYIVRKNAGKSSRILNWREKNTFAPWTSKNVCVVILASYILISLIEKCSCFEYNVYLMVKKNNSKWTPNNRGETKQEKKTIHAIHVAYFLWFFLLYFRWM